MGDGNLTEHEIRVLRMLHGEAPAEWGAWVSACLEFLSEAGYCTKGPRYIITQKGLDALDGIDATEAYR